MSTFYKPMARDADMTVEVMPARLTSEDLSDLAQAVRLLENHSFASRLTGLFGRQIEVMGRVLPAPARKIVAHATDAALRVALRVAVRSLGDKSAKASSDRLHKVAAAASGAIGGAFGLGALAIELPVSTTILLRSIADIARAEGEDLSRPEASIACIEVLALGGAQGGETALESGYFAVRAALSQTVNESVRFLAHHGLANEAAPAMVRLISQVAARFGVAVSEKLAAQAVPVIGAIGGGAVNAAFADHFQAMARGHFIVRRLERGHGADHVRFEYERLRNAELTKAKVEL